MAHNRMKRRNFTWQHTHTQCIFLVNMTLAKANMPGRQQPPRSGRHYLFFSYSIYHWLKIVIVVGCLAFYSVVIMGILLQAEEMDNIFNVSLATK